MATDPLIPRGNPLTELMDFTTAEGDRWVAYIEGYDLVRPRRLLAQTVLPGRRLRFDSATESRITPTRPAGAPFLPERRLLSLLAAAPVLGAESVPAARTRRQRLEAASAAWRRCVGRARRVADAIHSLEHAVLEGRWARS